MSVPHGGDAASKGAVNILLVGLGAETRMQRGSGLYGPIALQGIRTST